jgi:dihydropteroate synthase
MSSWTSPHHTPLPAIGSRTLLMGILNVTPDSFSDGGDCFAPDLAVEGAAQMVSQGADLIDIGGESTRPGSLPISAEEEAARILPVIRQLKHKLPRLPISVDTYKADVAAAAIEAGADMINDVWGLKFGLDPAPLALAADAIARSQPIPDLPVSPMGRVAAAQACPVILMHNRSTRDYHDFWPQFLAELQVSLHLARAAGIPDRQIWLDPGFGFGKGPAHNLEALKHLDRVAALGFPILLGTSRKSTLGLVLDRPVDQRQEGTAATLVWGVAKGCQMVRIHEVAAMQPFIRMADAIHQGVNFPPPDSRPQPAPRC